MLLEELPDYTPQPSKNLQRRQTKGRLLSRLGIENTKVISGYARAFDRQFMQMRDGDSGNPIQVHDLKLKREVKEHPGRELQQIAQGLQKRLRSDYSRSQSLLSHIEPQMVT